MTRENQFSPWICHVCDRTFQDIESTACSICYKTTCAAHLRHVAHFNPESDLYELRPICLHCAVTGSS